MNNNSIWGEAESVWGDDAAAPIDAGMSNVKQPPPMPPPTSSAPPISHGPSAPSNYATTRMPLHQLGAANGSEFKILGLNTKQIIGVAAISLVAGAVGISAYDKYLADWFSGKSGTEKVEYEEEVE